MDGNDRLAPVGYAALFAAIAVVASNPTLCLAETALPSPDELKRMSLEELMDIEVTLVSRHAEKLSEAASAVQVITQEDIRRSGASTLPEALRLASNLQVAQVDGREWAISARGFNNTAANKLLVMIDGRTVYTPLYSGVFWDAQHVLLEDVDRIEVVSGPGGTLWGSNAVNGVINIVTKDAKSSQGGYFATGAGTYLHDFIQGRFGDRVGQNAFFRVYSQRIQRNSTVLANGRDAKNGSGLAQGGFRMDWQRSDSDRLTVQGDLYDGAYRQGAAGKTSLTGQDVIGRWNHTFSPESELQAQAYFDRTWRKSTLAPGFDFTSEVKTYDFDLHHRFPLGQRQNIIWGAGYRLMQDDIGNFAFLAFLPARKDLQRFNAFAQDEIALVPKRLKLILGSKLEHEDYSGWNVQPAGRAAWTPDDRQTVWGAVSRAVRTPSRIDVEFYAPQPPVAPGTLKFAGSPEFESENLIAYELGYRIQPLEAISLSLAAFYNRYDDMRSVELPNPANLTVEFRNGLEGDSRGAELSGRFQATHWWKVHAGYTYLEKDIWEKAGHKDFTNPRGEWNDPAHQASLQSFMDLPAGFQLNVSAYYVDDLPLPAVHSRFTYDAGIVWLYRNLEFSVHGRNLADDQDPEFLPKDRVVQEVPRSVSGRLAWRL